MCESFCYYGCSGRVAQLVEQRPFKAWVAGSNPAALTMTFPRRNLPASPAATALRLYMPAVVWQHPSFRTLRSPSSDGGASSAIWLHPHELRPVTVVTPGREWTHCPLAHRPPTIEPETGTEVGAHVDSRKGLAEEK